jgi:hypothetical protein
VENRTITAQLVPVETDDLNTDIKKEPVLDVVVYIPLDRFSWNKPPGEATLEPGNLAKYRAAGETMIRNRVKDLNSSLTIYGVKKAYLGKIPDNWMTYDVWFTEMLKYYQNNKAYELDLIHQSGTVSRAEWVDDCTMHDVFEEIAKDISIDMHPEWKLLADIQNTYANKNKYEVELTESLKLGPEHYNSISSIAINLGLIERPISCDKEKWYTTQSTLLERWPLLKYIDSYYYGDKKHIIKALKGYLTTYGVPNNMDEHQNRDTSPEDQPTCTITRPSDKRLNPHG